MNLVKTTITIPEDTLQRAKLYAIQQKKTMSELMREALESKLHEPKTPRKEPTHRLGVVNLGINKIYNKRSDLYEDHLKRKMGY